TFSFATRAIRRVARARDATGFPGGERAFPCRSKERRGEWRRKARKKEAAARRRVRPTERLAVPGARTASPWREGGEHGDRRRRRSLSGFRQQVRRGPT